MFEPFSQELESLNVFPAAIDVLVCFHRGVHAAC